MNELNHTECNDWKTASSREWLETNGIGGYASSTVSGANTRRYHGLLVAATRPPLGRVVLLSKFEETLVFEDGTRFELSANQYPNTVHPRGFEYLTNFRLDPFPRWTYEIDGVVLEKSVFMIHGENSVVCRWALLKPARKQGRNTQRGDTALANARACATLEFRPIVAFRDFHHLRREREEFEQVTEAAGILLARRGSFDIDMPTLNFVHNAVDVKTTGVWYQNFEYEIERERGFDFREDLYQPFCLTFDLSDDAVVIASDSVAASQNAGFQPASVNKGTQAGSLRSDVEVLESAEIKRRKDLIKTAGVKDYLTKQLTLAADQFIVSRGTGKTIIAGYHWFSDWGRDTMIALNGLTLATGRPKVAVSILSEFAKHISEGMLPNRFPDDGDEPEYNTVDATLWCFEAVRAYTAKTDDYKFVREVLYEKLTDIIDWHVRGTRHQIHVDSDGLLFAGEEGVQLTWMDAKIGDWTVTPRNGKPVEIQALWFNALSMMLSLAQKFKDKKRASQFTSMANAAKKSFNRQFWNAESACLFDVVNGSVKDASIRPNQIFAVSLPFTMLSAEQARNVVDKVEKELLTPVGLRSLSPGDTRYVPSYIGSPLNRDSAYHQGTVWAWLIGPFIDAYRKTHPKGARTEKRVAVMLSGLRTHISEATIGQVSEIFDADPPHTPRGAAAQAWSVAELLRVMK